MAIKLTLSLDEATVECLRATAARLGRPKSAIVRDAIRDYSARADRLSEAEKQRMLAAMDRYAARVPLRDPDAVRRELAEIRAARRGWGRLHPVEPGR